MSLFGTGRRDGFLAVLVLLGLTLVAHFPGLALGERRVAVDGDGLHSENGATAIAAAAATRTEAASNQMEFLPAMAAAGATLRDGEWPLWNDRARFGEPFWVSGAPLLYPPFWPLLLPDGWRFLELVMALHAFLACLFMYRFLRARPLSRYVAFLGGGSYGIGWFLTAQLDRLPEAAAAALLPLALGATWRLLVTRKRDLYGLWLGLAIALMFLSGGTATATMGTILCAVLFFSFISLLERSELGHALRTFGAAALFAALLTAPLWLAAWQYGGELEPRLADGRHMQLGGFLAALAPGAMGGLDAVPAALSTVNPHADPLELVLFPGALILVLLVLGLFRPKRTWHGLFWVLVGAAGLLLGLDGPAGDGVHSLTGWSAPLPGIALVLTQVAAIVLGCVALENFFDAPGRRTFALPVVTALTAISLLAVVILGFLAPATGADFLARFGDGATGDEYLGAVRHVRGGVLATAIVCTVICGLFCIWHWLGILRFKTALAVVTFAGLLGVVFMQVPRTTREPMPVPWVDRLPAEPGRVITAGRQPLAPAAWLMARGIAAVPTAGTHILGRTAEFLRLVDPTMVQGGPRSHLLPLLLPELVDHPLLTLAAVDTAVAPRPFFASQFPPPAAAPPGSAADGGPYVAWRSDPSPRARLAFQAAEVPDALQAQRALAAVATDAANLRESVVIEGVAAPFDCRRPASPATLESVSAGSNALEYRVAMGQGRGYLVVADAWSPGWQATVDGAPAPILHANLAFRAVALPEGNHVVRLQYRPWAVSWGLPLLAAGLALCIAWVVLVLCSVIRPPSFER